MERLGAGRGDDDLRRRVEVDAVQARTRAGDRSRSEGKPAFRE